MRFLSHLRTAFISKRGRWILVSAIALLLLGLAGFLLWPRKPLRRIDVLYYQIRACPRRRLRAVEAPLVHVRKGRPMEEEYDGSISDFSKSGQARMR